MIFMYEDAERLKDAHNQGYQVLFAYHGYGSWEGEWFALLKKDGQLYTDEGSHCSCYDWDYLKPQETTIKTELARLPDMYNSWRSPFSFASNSYYKDDKTHDQSAEARRAYVDLILSLAAQDEIDFKVTF